MTLVGLAACLESTAPKSGEMSLAMPANPGILDSGHVVLSGPTAKTVTVAPGSTVTISGLDPGTYTVGLVGFYGGGAAYTAQVSGVIVEAGKNTTPAVPALVASFGVTVTPGSVSIAPGATQQFTAVAKDAQNNTISGITFFWASSNQNAALVDQTGLATGVAGGTATISALGLGVPGSASLSVGAVAATQLAFSTQPTSSTAGAAFSPAVEVEVRDASGQRVTTSRAAVTLEIGTNAGGGTLLGSVIVNAANGIASFSGVSINKTGTGYALSARSTGLTSATSSTFNISPGPPAKLAFTVQPPNAEANVAFTPAVTILDQFDNVTTSTSPVTVDLETRDPLGRLDGTTTVNAVAGVATFSDLRIVQPGSGYALTARSGLLPIAASDGFAVSITFSQLSGGDGTQFGYGFTCGVAPGGAFCWGSAYFGRLGVPEDARITGCPNNPCEWSPVLVRGGHKFTQLSAGDIHACAVDDAGAVWCWGYNNNGQLGDGTTTNRDSPVKIVGATGSLTFDQVAAGALHSCARTTQNAVWCWGYNASGQVGNNTTAQQTTPVQVLNTGTGPLDFKTIAAGGFNTCGINASGVAYCWGEAGNGANGDNDATNDNLTPGAVSGPTAGAVTYKTAPGSIDVSHFAGAGTACAIESSSALYCWGYNGSGQQGNGNTTTQLIPLQAGGGLKYTSVTLGTFHGCGVADDTTTRCWGDNGYGQLGDGTTTSRNMQGLVTTTETFVRVTAGYLHSCGLRANGQAFCWGYNSSGQLGNQNVANQSTPVPVKQR